VPLIGTLEPAAKPPLDLICDARAGPAQPWVRQPAADGEIATILRDGYIAGH
jgi:hypothetical protein